MFYYKLFSYTLAQILEVFLQIDWYLNDSTNEKDKKDIKLWVPVQFAVNCSFNP